MGAALSFKTSNMKLYATVTSERATKSQGGNKRIDIQLQGNEGVALGVIVLREITPNNYHIGYIYQGQHVRVASHIFPQKGEKQKGE